MRNMKVKFVYPVIQLPETGRRLKDIRLLRGLSVNQVSELLGGISVQAVYKWERGESIPSTDNLVALSRLYRVNMEALLVYKEAGKDFTLISHESAEPDQGSSFILQKAHESAEPDQGSFIMPLAA